MWNSTTNTPVLDSFMGDIREFVQSRHGTKLQDYLQLEPPLAPIYNQMVSELRQTYPRNENKDSELLAKCEKIASSATSESTWSAFPLFMRLYFTFLRDVNVENLLETYNLLKDLLNQSVIAFGDSQMGVILLPTVLYLSKVLSKLAIGLDRKPELIAHILNEGAELGQNESAEKVTLVEKSTNIVREAFIKCITDRSGTVGRPEGRRAGIYLMANLCLKLLFKCGKLRNAEQMLTIISTQSPPLEYFPASQRVTYLYYLGRYFFSNNLFYPAQIVLQAAHEQCHRDAISQKRLILVYLIPCNIIMGRFPTQGLLQRPEANGFGEKFVPLCQYIAKGDIRSFREYLSDGKANADWFAARGLLLPIRNRCEILVWRSLTRKVFIHAGFHGDPNMQAQRAPPPFLYLQKLETAVRWLMTRPSSANPRPNPKLGIDIVSYTEDIDFNQCDNSVDDLTNFDDFTNPDWYFNSAGQRVDVRDPDDLPDDSLIDENEEQNYPSPYSTLQDGGEDHPEDMEQEMEHATPLTRELESILASLLTQDLMRGYLTHKNPRYAIPGARIKGALPTGFPNVWQTIYARESEDNHIPGWVKALTVTQSSISTLGGRVVNLSGARSIKELTGG
ncbi:hypothetical protein FQN57_006328 [Myotisia sp. PD_48]|nr:hypothetical protein FQN57_006328 [Myotisia sp. PD_48]